MVILKFNPKPDPNPNPTLNHKPNHKATPNPAPNTKPYPKLKPKPKRTFIDHMLHVHIKLDISGWHVMRHSQTTYCF